MFTEDESRKGLKLNIAKMIKECISSSVHPEFFDDDIQPSLRRMTDGDLLRSKLLVLINALEL